MRPNLVKSASAGTIDASAIQAIWFQRDGRFPTQLRKEQVSTSDRRCACASLDAAERCERLSAAVATVT
jgi:hypothetical protein